PLVTSTLAASGPFGQSPESVCRVPLRGTVGLLGDGPPAVAEKGEKVRPTAARLWARYARAPTADHGEQRARLPVSLVAGPAALQEGADGPVVGVASPSEGPPLPPLLEIQGEQRPQRPPGGVHPL